LVCKKSLKFFDSFQGVEKTTSAKNAAFRRIVDGELDFDTYTSMIQLLGGREPPLGEYIPGLATRLLDIQEQKIHNLKKRLHELDTLPWIKTNNVILDNAFHRSVPYASLYQFKRETGSASKHKMDAANQYIRHRYLLP